MTNLRQLFSTRKTAQNQPIPGSGQVPNSAGGYAWQVDDWQQLDRFLILGSENGTYYIRPEKLTVDNANAVIRCLDEDGVRVVKRVVEISEGGRAPKNDPALFVLAMAAGLGDEVTRQAALAALPQVARTGTHLFHFMEFVEGFRGWGRALRRGIGEWYTGMAPERLAYQVVKYQQRDGWSHRDALRLAHPKAPTAVHNILFNWMTQGWNEETMADLPLEDMPALKTVWAFEQAKALADAKDAAAEAAILNLIEAHNLPWEAVPSNWHGSTAVWKALLPRLPMNALIRNLARLTANGVLTPGSDEMKQVVTRLRDPDQLVRARVHPIAALSALMTYQQGKGTRGSLTWEPLTAVIDALDKAFYKTFKTVEPTGKRLVLALDVSGSMAMGTVAGVPGLSPRVASAAMALVTAATESDLTIVGFSHKMVRLNISARQRLDDVVKTVSGLPFGRTDCALPMIWALKNKVKADAFVIYTDSETWYGNTHPVQVLHEYREKTGIPAKLIVVGMVSNMYTIADPYDPGTLDVVGFDTAVPQVMSDFIRN